MQAGGLPCSLSDPALSSSHLMADPKFEPFLAKNMKSKNGFNVLWVKILKVVEKNVEHGSSYMVYHASIMRNNFKKRISRWFWHRMRR